MTDARKPSAPGRPAFALPPNVERSRVAVDEELQFHIDEHAAELMAGGMPREEAVQRAMSSFQDLGGTRKALHHMDARETHFSIRAEAFRDLLTDMKRVVRGLVRRPGVALLASGTLALGIGANAIMYGLVHHLLLSAPPHIVAPEQVVRPTFDEVMPPGPGRTSWMGTSYQVYRVLNEHTPSFAAAAGWFRVPATMLDSGTARIIDGVAVTDNYFDVLGTRAVRGTLPTAVNAGDAQWLVISHALWVNAFQRRDDVIGRSVFIGGEPYRIVAVAPRAFTGPWIEPTDFWMSIDAPATGVTGAWKERSDVRALFTVARMRDGVALARAADDATSRYRVARAGTPVADSTARVILSPTVPDRLSDLSTMSPNDRVIASLQIVSILVLLIALFNVLNLFLLRAIDRQRETAISLALGISGVRFARFVILEYLTVAVASTGLAVLFVYLAGPVIWRLALLPGADVGALMSRVIGVTIGIAVVAVIVLTSITAFVQSRTNLIASLRDGARGVSKRSDRIRDTLVVAQVALTFVLAIGAGLFVRSLSRAGALDWGFDTRNVVMIRMSPARLELPGPQAVALSERARERLRSLPGVQLVAMSQNAPLQPSATATFRLPGRDQLPNVGPNGVGYPTFFAVAPEFFDALGIRLLRGRTFTAADAATTVPVVVVDETMARTFWPAGDALGQCVHIGPDPAPCRTVIGVVEDIKRWIDEKQHFLRYYMPLAQSPSQASERFLFVRSAEGDAARLIPGIRELLSREHPAAGVSNVVAMHSMLDPYTKPWRLGMSTFVGLGILAEIIATLGLYGIISYAIARRQRELGIRLALGSAREAIVWLVVGGAMRRVALAVACGIGLALLGGRLVRSMLYATPATDVAVFVAGSAIAMLTALLASAIPAWRASRVDPASTLRSD